MLHVIVNTLGSGKQALTLISLIVVITIVDSQFINLFYATNLGVPGNLHFLLFVSFVIAASIINIVSLFFVKRNDIQKTTVFSSNSRPLLLKVTSLGTTTVQYAIFFILFIAIFEMLVLHAYHKTFSLLIIYLSHFWSVGILGVLSFTLFRWFRFARSFSILVYGLVFSVIIFLSVVTLPLLTQQFTNESELIYPRYYTVLITNVNIPSPDIAFIYGLGNYVLPLMIVSSWVLTVSLLKQYISRIGKKKFWLLVSIPLLYQLFTFIVRDANLITDPALVGIIYSRQFQFLFAISYQVSALFFAVAYLSVARKMKRKIMKNYLIISSIGVASLFSSIQPGMPFYAAYPPFGLVTLSFLGFSSYLLLVGMLGCAAYVSRDSEIRKEIHKGLVIDSDLLKMGRAEMQRDIESRVRTALNKVKLSDDMRNRMDPDEDEVKVMIEEVLSEIHGKR